MGTPKHWRIACGKQFSDVGVQGPGLRMADRGINSLNEAIPRFWRLLLCG
jgi:hypothetical protein